MTLAPKALGRMKPDQSPRGSDLGQRSKMQRLHTSPEEAGHAVLFSKEEGTSGRRMPYSSPASPHSSANPGQPRPRFSSLASPALRQPCLPKPCLPGTTSPAHPSYPAQASRSLCSPDISQPPPSCLRRALTYSHRRPPPRRSSFQRRCVPSPTHPCFVLTSLSAGTSG